MAVITPQAIDLTGLIDATYAAANAAGDTFVNDGRTMLHVVTTSTGCTVTIDSLVASDFGDDADIAVVLATGEEAFIGPFRTDRFNSAAGLVTVTYSDDTGVTVAALALDARGW